MPEILQVVLIASITVAATGLGALPVMAASARAAAVQPVLDGIAAGVMAVAAIVGLLIPAFRDGEPLVVAAGVVGGVALVSVARRGLRRHSAAAHQSVEHSRAELTFGVLFVHSLPEGLALGCAIAAGGDIGLLVVLAITIQNIPEGTAIAAVLRRDGQSGSRQFWAAVASSAPQIPGALIAWLAVDSIEGLLPISFALAGGAMLWLVIVDMVPGSWKPGRRTAVATGGAIGVAAMVALDLLLQV